MKSDQPGSAFPSRHSRIAAFTLIELVVVIGIAVVLVFLLFPAMSRAKQRAWRISCTSNLKQIGLSFKTWELDNSNSFPAHVSITNSGTMELAAGSKAFMHFVVMSNELSTPKVLLCPADVGRAYATNFNKLGNSNLSYFVGLDADSSMPQMFLSGDRNLTNGLPVTNSILYLPSNRAVGWTHELHNCQGNIGLADGSVQQFSPFRLNQAFTNAGAPNRLAIP
jgi:competence protein ComGC